MILHYIALPIAVLMMAMLVVDLVKKRRENIKVRVALILISILVYFASGLAIDWVKAVYRQSRPQQSSQAK